MVTPTRLLIGFVLVSLTGLSRAEDATNSVPRYRFEPGQELKYHGTSQFKYENGSHGSKVDWQVWVVRKNDDGSTRIVLRSSHTFSQLVDGREVSPGSPRVTLAYCDVFPDGRVVPNETLGFNLDPSAILPRLPANDEQARQGWTAEGTEDGSRTDYKPAAGDGSKTGSWVFSGERQSGMDRIYEMTSGAKYFFDRSKAVIGRIESQSTQGYGFQGKGTGSTELTSVEQHDGDWAKAFARESDRYFKANKAYEDLIKRAMTDTKEAESRLSQAERALTTLRDELTLPVMRDQVDDRLRSHKESRSYWIEEAKNRAKVVGKDAADWETKDIDGKTHSLKGYRGKVVILDFWYRGCGWCIRAMPQMIRLADEFKDRPVAVLGMNTDRKEEDARFVVQAMKLNYPALKAEGLPEKYGVRGFPTLIIIDQEGKVADIHVGYSPDLKVEVSKIVEGLLARK